MERGPMADRGKTIQMQLFIHFAWLLVGLILLITGGFYLHLRRSMREQAIRSVEETALRLAEQLDYEIQSMNDISIRVAYSGLIKDRFLRYMEAETTAEDYLTKKVLLDIFMAIIGPRMPVHQINLYEPNGDFIGAGFFNGAAHREPGELSWLEETQAAEGSRVISPPPYRKNRFGKEVLTLTRLLYNRFNQPIGYIEVEQEVERVFRGVDGPEQSMRILVYDERKRLLYPPGGPDYETARREADRGEIALEAPAEFCGFRILVLVSRGALYLSIDQMTRIVLMILLAALAASMGVSFLLAGRITRPLSELHREIGAMNWESLGGAGEGGSHSGLDELEELRGAFRQMNRRLLRSMEESIALKTQETNARIQALQARMNPHFLYNSIANISIMAEEGADREIVQSCAALSAMLRYVSEGEAGAVPLSREIAYTRSYLKMMKFRYLEKLDYRIDLEEGAEDTPVRKLLIQPLAENALKHSLNETPPWVLRIRAYREKGYWLAEVRDNGPGFAPSFLESFSRGRGADPVPGCSSGPGGMGLRNIAARLRLRYGDRAVMDLENLPEGGALVRIGAPLSGEIPGRPS